MDTRIVLPGAMAGAMVLGIAFSALVPTRMVGPKAPPLADVVDQGTRSEPGPTYAFMPSPPSDLDPSLPFGPRYARDEDEVKMAVTSRGSTSRPVYVAVNYEISSVATDPPPSEPAAVALPARFEGLY